jgi:hypothetical protein
MVKRKKENIGESTLWLLISVAGGVLFAFGLLDLFKSYGWSPYVAVITGASVTFGAIYFGKYRTETSFAIKKK